MGNVGLGLGSICGGKGTSDERKASEGRSPRSVNAGPACDPMLAEGVSSLRVPSKPGPPDTMDWAQFCEGCSDCVIFCHGGCPDGLASALLVQRALSTPATQIPREKFTIVQLYHVDRAKIAAEMVAISTAALYVDITPYEEDLPILRKARVAAVIDHHKSVTERMDNLTQSMISLRNLSYVEDHHSAASLVGHQMGYLLADKIDDFEKKIAILRKKDVWDYKIDKKWAEEAELFRAFIGKGTDCTIDMMNEFLDDFQIVMDKGKAAVQVQIDAAAAMFLTIKIIGEEEWLKVGVLRIVDGSPYDSKHLLKLCTGQGISILLVVPHDVQKGKGENGADVVNIILKRTVEKAGDVGAYAKELFENDKVHGDKAIYLGGGGHPFAAGLQVNAARNDVDRVGQDIFHLAVKFLRKQNEEREATEVAEIAKT